MTRIPEPRPTSSLASWGSVGAAPRRACPALEAGTGRLVGAAELSLPGQRQVADCLADGALALRMLEASDAVAVHEEASNEEARRWAFDGATPDPAVSADKAARAPLHWLVGPVADLAMIDLASGAVAASRPTASGKLVCPTRTARTATRSASPWSTRECSEGEAE
jgi:hypothetical protein